LVVLDLPAGSALDRGATLLDLQDKAVGQLTSISPDPDRNRAIGLGYVKSVASAPDTVLRAGTVELRVGALAGGD
jgi:hypothetical protein